MGIRKTNEWNAGDREVRLMPTLWFVTLPFRFFAKRQAR